jgi:hypothetical protein
MEADMAGPLPTGTAIRRNAPTIPTTNLPVAGRVTPVPDPPVGYEFGAAASDWWGWAWRTPQACAWDDGSLFVVARRALFEDDLAEAEDAKARLGLSREMREMDDRLGLTPKGLAANRWKIVADDQAAPTGAPTKPRASKGRRALKAVPAAS